MANPPLNTVNGAGTIVATPSISELYLGHADVVFPPTELTSQAGWETITGTYADLATKNAIVHHFDEVNAAANKLITYGFATGDTRPPAIIKARCFYTGGAAHNHIVEIYNYDTTTWDAVTGAANDLTAQTTLTDYVWELDPDTIGDSLDSYVDVSGNCAVRFSHVDNGNASHVLDIDYLAIVKASIDMPTLLTDYTIVDLIAGENSDVTQSASLGKMTIVTAGQYFIIATAGFESLALSEVTGHVFLNGIEQPNIGLIRGFGSTVTPGSAGISGMLDLASNDYIEIKFRSDRGNNWISLQHFNLSIMRLN